MTRIRLRSVTDTGDTAPTSAVIKTSKITLTIAQGSSATLTFTASRKKFSPTAFPFLVAVERRRSNGYVRLAERDLYIVETDADDSKDSAAMVTYTATEFVPWLLAGAYVGTGDFQKDGERIINGDGSHRINAGHLMQYFIQESKSRGWLTPLNYDFTPTKDSAGLDWLASDREKIGWRLETFYSTVLQKLTEQNLCEWSTSSATLRLFRPGTRGVDRSSAIVLGGSGFTRVPVKQDVTGFYTHVLGVSEAGRTHAVSSGTESRFGRRSVVMNQTGVKDLTASTRLANEMLAKGTQVKREESFEWRTTEGLVEPWEHFDIGDLVSTRTRGGMQSRRVIGIIVTQDDGSEATVQARVGERISTLAGRNQAALNGVTGGAISGGSGGSFPTAPPLPAGVPAAPTALRVDTNVGYWGSRAQARASVTLAWGAVTSAIDGEELTISGYELWSRPIAKVNPTRDTSTETTTATVDTWTPSAVRAVKVRAISAKGVAGEWSDELTVTPATPAPVVPKAPTGLEVVSSSTTFGAAGAETLIMLGFTHVTETVSNEPADVDMYELILDGIPQQRAQSSPFGIKLLFGESKDAHLRAHSVEGGWSDLSAKLTITAGSPTLQPLDPTAPTLVSGFGSVVVRWDGDYTTAPGSGADVVTVQRKVGAAWVQVGTVLSRDGSVTVSSTKGATEVIRFAAYDRLGRLSGVSAEASIVVDGVNVGQLDGQIEAGQILFNEAMGDAIFANEAYYGRVNVDNIHPNVGEVLNIAGNESVNIMAGRTDELEGKIAELSDDAAKAQQDANDAKIAAAAADAAALTAQGAALVAQTQTEDINRLLSDQRVAFQVNTNDVRVVARTGNFSFRITATGAAIYQGNTPVSRWDALQFIHEDIYTETVNFTGHVIDSLGSDSTVIKKA